MNANNNAWLIDYNNNICEGENIAFQEYQIA